MSVFHVRTVRPQQVRGPQPLLRVLTPSLAEQESETGWTTLEHPVVSVQNQIWSGLQKINELESPSSRFGHLFMSSEGPISSSDDDWVRWSRPWTTLAGRIKSVPVPLGRRRLAGFQTQHPLLSIAQKVYMNTQWGGKKKQVSTFFPVESPKNFLIYLIASPRAIWPPRLDRCALIFPLRVST